MSVIGNRENRSKISGDFGNTIIEFILFLLLLVLPIFTYFSAITLRSNQQLRDEELFREVVRIVRDGSDFADAISTAHRFLTLHQASGDLNVICLSGECPKRGSNFRVRWQSERGSMESVISGGSWN